jgi:uncharacterized membrane protein (DUF2068 family)
MSEGALQEQVIGMSVTADEAEPHAEHDGGLLAIGIFKLLKSAFFFCVGIGAIRLLHSDLGDVAMRLVNALHRDPEGRFVGFLMHQVDMIDTHHLLEVGWFSFAYSALALTEGIGLMLERVWAEYLTLCLTISFLPWELYELVRKFDTLHVSFLLTNLVVLLYLLWLLRRKKEKRQSL